MPTGDTLILLRYFHKSLLQISHWKKHNIKQSAETKERCQYYDIYPRINELNLYLFIFCHNEPPVVLILVF